MARRGDGRSVAYRSGYSIGFTVEAEKSELSSNELHDGGEPTREFEKVHGSGAVVSGRSSILFAAARLQGKGEQTFAQDVFNGKLAAPAVWTEGQKVSWEFSQDMDSQAVPATNAGGHN